MLFNAVAAVFISESRLVDKSKGIAQNDCISGRAMA